MVTRDMIICGDFKSTDRFFFFSDMGWMVGAMCACIPSFTGASLLVAEGTPDYPDTGRFWRLIAEHHVTYLTLDNGAAAPDAVEQAREYCHELFRVPVDEAPRRSPRDWP